MPRTMLAGAWLMTLSLALSMPGAASANLLTYHVNATAGTSDRGVPGGQALTLQFTIDDSTPASFDSPVHAEYIGAVVGGFLSYGGTTFALSGFNFLAFQNDEDLGGTLLDQILISASIDFADALPGFGPPTGILFAMTSFGTAAPTVLNSVALSQPLPAGSAFDYSNLYVNFLDGDSVTGTGVIGPAPGPAVSEPPAAALLALALGVVCAIRVKERARRAA